MIKVCPICKTTFDNTPSHHSYGAKRMYCSQKCRTEARERAENNYYRTERKISRDKLEYYHDRRKLNPEAELY